MKKLFGSPSKSTSTTESGYSVLPGFAKQGFRNLGSLTQDIVGSPEEFFQPMDLTPEELAAREMIQPEGIRGSIEQYMSPYRDIVFEDINRAFEQGPLARLNQGANQAGAFGSSRYGQGVYDVTRGLTDALRSASQSAFETALGQRQQGISNLLGFGQLARGVDLSRRQALPSAVQFGRDIYSPLLSSQRNTQTQREGSGGLLGAVGPLAGLATGIGGLTSHFGMTGGYDPFSGITWNTGRR